MTARQPRSTTLRSWRTRSLTEDNIRSLYGNKEIFDAISQDIFRELFIESVGNNRYLTRYGRKKIDKLFRGLLQIKTGDSTYRELADRHPEDP